LIELLLSKFAIKKWDDSVDVDVNSDEYRRSLIEDYVFNNYVEPISLGDMAEALHLSEAYLSRLIKKMYGVGFSVMLKQVRLTQALNDLLYTNHSITRIAYDNGFSNSAYFTRVFKETYDKNPKEFRAEQSAGKVEDKAISHEEEKLEKYLQGELSQDGYFKEEESSYINTSNAEDYNAAWSYLFNGGSALALLRSETQKNLIKLKSTLNFKYIRFWDIFAKEILIEENGSYSFSRIDELMDYIVNIGLTPFIVLQEKAKQVHRSEHYKDDRVVFESLEKWNNLYTTLLKRWVRRYGIDVVSQWKIEVWFNGIRIQGVSEEDAIDCFFKVFNSTYSITKSLVPDLSVGGCGFWPDFSLDVLQTKKNFWEKWKDHALKPDFASIMCYAYDEEPGSNYFTRLSSDTSYLLHAIQKTKRELENIGWNDVKLVVSEWNMTVSDRNYLNDSCFMGAYIVKNMIECLNQADIIGFYSGMDLYTEYYEARGLLSGGNGLLNRNGISKPSAHALSFLNMLYPSLVAKSEHYMVTRNKWGNYSIICHNMKPLNYYYYSFGVGVDKIEKENLWKCFDDTTAISLPITLMGVGEKKLSN
jgi:beta-xylosidase/AraC-like DNA-binding protein